MKAKKTRIEWVHTALVEDVNHYRVYFDTDELGAFLRYYLALPKYNSANQSVIIDTPIEDTWYKISAVNDAGEGALMDAVLLDIFQTVPTVPTDLTFTLDPDATDDAPPMMTVDQPEPPPMTVPFANDTNLAPIGRITSTTTPAGALGEYPAANAINGKQGDDSDRWSIETLSSGTTFLEVDLYQNVTVNGFILDAYQNRAYKFKVEAKPDGGSYAVVADLTANTDQGPIIHVLSSPVAARYYKLTITGVNDYTGNWVSIREFQIYGPAVPGLAAPIDPMVAFERPGGIHRLAQMTVVANRINNNVQPNLADYNTLVKFANTWLNKSPNAIEAYSIPAYYGNESKAIAGKARMQDDMWSAFSCGVVYRLNQLRAGVIPTSDKYADQALRILNNWASVNKSIDVNTGDSALVTAYTSPGLLIAAECVWNYSGFTDAQKTQFLNWTKGPLHAAAENKKLRSLERDGNGWFRVPAYILSSSGAYMGNQNSWGLLASLSVAHITENETLMAENVQLCKYLIGTLIKPDGTMPDEMARNERSILYTGFSLEPLTASAEIIRNSTGTNLYNYSSPAGSSLKSALTYLFDKGIANPSLWPKAGTSAYVDQNRHNTLSLYAAMGRVYGIKAWQDYGLATAMPELETGTGWAIPNLIEPSAI